MGKLVVACTIRGAIVLGRMWRRTRRRSDRKSTRLNSSHLVISYAVFCLKKKNNIVESHNAIDKIRSTLLSTTHSKFVIRTGNRSKLSSHPIWREPLYITESLCIILLSHH